MTQKPMDELGARLRELFASTPAQDLERNLKVLLSNFFARMDLVSREEFDVQAKVLARTREKLSSLESRLRELESRQPTQS